jgi:peptidoglycan/LPS O-acetylase OafA/YrhL
MRNNGTAALLSSSTTDSNYPRLFLEWPRANCWYDLKNMQHKIPQLDAVRGLAILLVLLHNMGSKYPLPYSQWLISNGWMGVDLFFVLSGFLITGVLLRAKSSEGYFKDFYARRCLRIWPLYYSLLIFMFVLIPLVRPSEAHMIFEPRSSPWWAYPLFLQNFLVPIPTMATGPLAVTWSLAIEEQFYLVWPFMVRFFSPIQLRRIAIGVICVAPALRYYLSAHHVIIYSNVFCRLDGLMAGALLALMIRNENFVPSLFVARAWIVLALAAPLALIFQKFDAQWMVFSFTALASAAFVYLAMFSAQPWLQVILNNRFLIFTGTISYGLYLLHKIPMDMVQSLHLSQSPLVAFAVSFAAAFALAILSWNVLEKPFLALKRFFKPSPAQPNSQDDPGLLASPPAGSDLPH